MRSGRVSATQLGHNVDEIAKRWKAFGWHAVVVDGHDVAALLAAYDEARATRGRPTVIVARTIKGRGISFAEGKDGWHGKPLKDDEMARAIAELEAGLIPGPGASIRAGSRIDDSQTDRSVTCPKTTGDRRAAGL